MATVVYTLANKDEFYEIADTGVDFVAKNASAAQLTLVHLPNKPTNGAHGSPITARSQINRDPAATDKAWVSSPMAGARVAVEKL